jgi:hypothetical protein
MLRRLRPRSVYDVCAALALFVALGGTAYAVNTVGSTDIIDGQVKSVDVGDGEINSADVKDQSLTTFDVSTFLGADVVDGTLTGADISDNSIGVDDIGSQQVGPDEVINDSLLQSDIRSGAVSNDEVLDNTLISADVNDNSLTGADINEATLNLPQTPTTTTFASAVGQLDPNNQMGQWGLKFVPAGSYSVVATVHMWIGGASNGDRVGTAYCQLQNAEDAFIGGATDRRVVLEDDRIDRSLTITGGAQVPAGGGFISLHCQSQFGNDEHIETQLMVTRLDGFF